MSRPLRVVRWGRSAYETDAALAAERDGVEALGANWTISPRELPDLTGATVLVTTSKVRVDAEVVAGFPPCLELVLTTTSGFEHLDVAACRRAGVAVARLPEARRDAVIEHAMAEILTHLRRLDTLQARARAGVWARSELPTLAPRTLAGLPVAVVGLGVIGRKMASLLSAFGAQVLGVDPAGGPAALRCVSLDEALREASVVSVHCSLTPSAMWMLDAPALDLLPSGAIVINTARGRVLDVRAAAERVRDGRLGGISVDVFPEEPWPHLAEMAAIPGVRLTPHASGYTAALGDLVAEGVVRAVSAVAAGQEIPHRVDR
jgi:D-3-phosphoglycerate dehydrogenase